MDEQLTAETVNSQNRIGVDGWTQQEHEKWLELRIASDQAHKSELEALLGQIASVSAKKNAEQLMQDEAFNAAVTGYHSSLETEMQRHADQQKFIRDTMFLDTDLANSQMITEEITHQQTLSSIWATMTSDLSDEQKEQISGMLMFAAETKRTGVVLDKETQDVIKMILDSWETLPQEGKDTVANLIDPMLEDMGIKGVKLEGASEELGNRDTIFVYTAGTNSVMCTTPPESASGLLRTFAACNGYRSTRTPEKSNWCAAQQRKTARCWLTATACIVRSSLKAPSFAKRK